MGFIIRSSSGLNIASRFKNITDFDINSPGAWGQDDLVWNYKKLWGDEKAVTEHMIQFWPDASAGEVKGKTKPTTWFTRDSDDFLSVVLNEYFFMFDAEEQESVINNLYIQFSTARDNYYNEGGKVPVNQKQNGDKSNHNTNVVDIAFPFGPWACWIRPEWDEIEHEFKSARRKERLQDARRRVQKGADSSTTSALAAQFQRDRGRPEKRKKVIKEIGVVIDHR